MTRRNEQTYVVRLGKNGRIVIPAQERSRLALGEGDALLLTATEGGFEVLTHATRIARLQARHARYRRTDGTSVVDDLLTERRANAKREWP